MAANFQSAFGFIGGAVSDIFGAVGDKKAAGGYREAAKLTKQSAGLVGVAGEITSIRLRREAYRTIGGQGADIAASGFSLGGSGMDILRSSAADAALDFAISSTQTSIDQNALFAEAIGYNAQASQSETKAKGGFLSGIIGGIGAIASFAFSDRRLKQNIERIGTSPKGLPIYIFQYLGSEIWTIGCMADEVIKHSPEAVVLDVSGFYMVDYSKVDF